MNDATPPPGDPQTPPQLDTDERGYARDAWLHRRVLSHVDHEVGGAYSWNPSEYSPVPIDQDGETGLVFAKT